LKVAVDGTVRASDRYLLARPLGRSGPDPVQAAWLYAQMVRWGQAPLSDELLAARARHVPSRSLRRGAGRRAAAAAERTGGRRRRFHRSVIRSATTSKAISPDGPSAADEHAALGYIALTDAAPLIIAKEKGIFAKYGMPDVEVAKQASWGATRDNMVLGTEGQRHRRRAHPDADALPDLGRQGDAEQPADADVHPGAAQLDSQGISVSNEYKDLGVGLDASPLQGRAREEEGAGKEVKVAMTFPGGTHDLWIRYWLAAGGIDPDKDIETIVVPPPQMVANMKVGNMDASASASRGTSSSSTRTSASPPAPPASSGTSIPRRRSACAPTGSTRTRTPPRRI
jgi:hypothetical protein